jgi:hypothetical protein
MGKVDLAVSLVIEQRFTAVSYCYELDSAATRDW